tara:strand:- start:812 stop:1915 length:1104 start_codon:yes stop_codon:yes gene_type:complete
MEEARIQHAEDFLFWDGSAGAVRVLNSLEKLEQGVEDVTLKWDGSPAIIFGRDENGRLVLTDKSGFVAKGYDGKTKTRQDVQKMFMARPGAKDDPEGYEQLGNNMASIMPMFDNAIPKDFRGYYKGDLLYFSTPPIQEEKYVFKPQIVTYKVDVKSDMGKRIGESRTGVVIHRMIDEQGQETALPQGTFESFEGKDVFAVPPVTVQKTAKIDNTSIQELKQAISKFKSPIDELLNKSKLKQMKLSDFSQLLYNYTNSKVDTGMANMGQDFLQWLQTKQQVSDVKKKRISEYIQTHRIGFNALWDLHTKIMQVKDDVIGQFDAHDSDVKQSIDGHGEGGEGYVLAHPEGDMKLVPREYFSKANRAVER